MKEDFEKMRIALRYWLIGKEYYKAVEAMDFAEQHHTGLRKDGSPEFSHQVSQASLARTLIHSIRYKEELFITIFLHDTPEDASLSFEEVDNKYGSLVGRAVRLMTKVYRGVKTPNEVYYNNFTKNEPECEVASVAKGLDRVHNLMSMIGGFKPEKQVSYIQETLDFTVPMLKKAKRNFPHQENVYENIKFIMTNQVQLYNALNKELIKE